MKRRSLRTLLAPPVFPGDDATTLRAKLLYYALLCSVPFMALCAVAGLMGSHLPTLVIELEIGFAAASVFLGRWLFQGRIRLASGVFLAAGFIVITVVIARLGTIRTPATGFYMALVISAALFFNFRGMLFMIVLSSLSVAGLIHAENAGLLPRPDYAVTITQWIATTALFGCVGFWIFAVLKAIRSALQRAEQEVVERKRHETRFHLAMAAARQSWFELDLRTGTVVTSEEYARMLGFDPATFSSTRAVWVENIHTEDRPAVQELFNRSLASGQTLSAEYRRRTAAGGWLWIYSVGRVAEYDSAGKPVLFVGTHTDISERKKTEEALRESEERFRSLYENAVLGFYRTSPEGRILMANLSLLRMLGYASLDELNQRNLEREGFEPDYSRDAFKKRLEQEGQITGLEAAWKRHDGSVLFVNENCKVVKDGGGQVLYYEGSVEDITERKQAEEALRESEGRYRTIYDQASDGIVLMSGEGELPVMNEAFARMHGYTKAEMMRMQVKDLNTPETNRQLADRLLRFTTGETQTFEVQHYHKDGHVFPLEISGRRVLFNGKYYIQSICRNITERKQAEKALRLHGAALEAAANAIVITDRQGIIEWANPAFTKLSGWELTEALGKNPRELVKSDKHDAAFYQQMRKTILAGKVWQGEIINRRKDGTLRTEDMTITPLCDAKGEISHFIAIKQDITEQKIMETQFLQGQRMEAIGALAGGIAHDLNNILSPITMLTGLLKDKLTDRDDLEILAMAHTSALRGANIIKQLLTYSRGQEGERAPVQPRHLIHEMIEMMRETFPRDIDIQQRLPGSLWTVLANPTQLHQVLLNLCVNARDAMPTGGRLTIEAVNVTLAEGDPQLPPGAKPGAYVVISVSDTGHGIPPEILHRIFDPFFTTKPLGKGTGLGLSTVFGIVKNHGGFVVVDSTTQVGSTFRFGLPATDDDTIAAAVPLESVSLPAGGQTILVVDDERSIRDGVRRALEQQHFQVITAVDGKDALTQYLLHQEKISLVLTDLMMPMMSGVTLARALRAINPALEIAVMSGMVQVEEARELVALGIPDVLAKPFTHQTLFEIVHRRLTGA